MLELYGTWKTGAIIAILTVFC